MIRTSVRPRNSENIGLAEVDIGLRQCLQLLQKIAEREELEMDSLEDHWIRLTKRAIENLREDRQLLRRQSQLEMD